MGEVVMIMPWVVKQNPDIAARVSVIDSAILNTNH